MKKLPALLLALLISASTYAAEKLRKYDNPEIGVTLSYDTDWTVVQQSQILRAVESVDRKDVPTEGVAEVIPNISFSIVRASKVDGLHRNTNLLIMIMPVDKGDCEELNSQQFVDTDAREYIDSWPGSKARPELDVAIPGMKTYSASIPLDDRVLTQHRYIKCVNDSYVLLQTTSSTPEGETAVLKVLASVSVSEI